MSTALPDPVAPAQIERRGIRLGDVFFRGVALVAALGTTAVLVLLAYKVFDLAWPAIQHFGLSFIWTQGWNPNSEVFGALSFIYGTVVTASIALLLATPLSVAIALFLTEISPRRLAAPIATMVELLAAIPSVVLGLWGILVFGPWVAEHLEPFLERWLGFLPIFSGDPSQAGMLPAALVLTIMIVPITSAICRELFSRVPRDLTDGSLALGSTKWEAIRRVAIPYAAPGISAAVLLGLGRAFGEAIAVTQVIGSGNEIHASLFPPADTLASRIASRYQGASSGLEVGLAALSRGDSDGDLARHERRRAGDREQVPEGPQDARPDELDGPGQRLRHHRALERARPPAADAEDRRRARDPLAAAAVCACSGRARLGAHQGSEPARRLVLHQACGAVRREGGIADALLGSAIIVGMSVVFAVPVRFSSRSTSRSTRDRRRRRSSASCWTSSTASQRSSWESSSTACSSSATVRAPSTARLSLAILMVPLVARATQEVLELVPRHLREASLALGVPRWRTVYSIVLPTAIGGILTGVVIAVARVAGETAPLLFTSSITSELDLRRHPQRAAEVCRCGSSRCPSLPRRTTRRPPGPPHSY